MTRPLYYKDDIVFMCIKCELLDIISKEAEIKKVKAILSKENYLTTDFW